MQDLQLYLWWGQEEVRTVEFRLFVILITKWMHHLVYIS